MRTYVPSPDEIPHGWWVADAAGIPLGRLASVVAAILRGKNKPQFTPFLDAGDFVVVVNADKVVLTGRKLDQKIYRRHSGYPGGLKEIPARTRMGAVRSMPSLPATWSAVRKPMPRMSRARR